MNIWRFEVRQSLPTTLLWSVIITGLAALFMAIFPLYEEGADAFLTLLSAYPPEFLAAFNLNPETLFSYLGFYAFVLPFVFVVAAIYATNAGLSIVGREKQMQASDFLFAKPVARGKIWFQKSLAVKTLLLIQAVIFFAGMSAVAAILEPDVLQQPSFWLMTGAVFILQFVCSSVGMLVATLVKKLKNSTSLAIGIALSFYVISLLQAILENDLLRFFTPFQYVNPQRIVETQSYDVTLLIVAALVSFGACVVSYLYYTKQDIK